MQSLNPTINQAPKIIPVQKVYFKNVCICRVCSNTPTV